METEPARPGDKTVLVVDDDATVLDLLEFTISREGFRTERASDGLEAVRKAESAPPDLIVLDLMLPVKSGMDIIRDLQTSPARDVPIIVVTGRRMDRAAFDLLRREPNVRECLDKPIKPALFANLLHQVLRTRPEAKKAV